MALELVQFTRVITSIPQFYDSLFPRREYQISVGRVDGHAVHLLATNLQFGFGFASTSVPDAHFPIITGRREYTFSDHLSVLYFTIVFEYLRIVIDILPVRNGTLMVSTQQTMIRPLQCESCIQHDSRNYCQRVFLSSSEHTYGCTVNSNSDQRRVSLTISSPIWLNLMPKFLYFFDDGGTDDRVGIIETFRVWEFDLGGGRFT